MSVCGSSGMWIRLRPSRVIHIIPHLSPQFPPLVHMVGISRCTDKLWLRKMGMPGLRDECDAVRDSSQIPKSSVSQLVERVDRVCQRSARAHGRTRRRRRAGRESARAGAGPWPDIVEESRHRRGQPYASRKARKSRLSPSKTSRWILPELDMRIGGHRVAPVDDAAQMSVERRTGAARRHRCERMPRVRPARFRARHRPDRQGGLGMPPIERPSPTVPISQSSMVGHAVVWERVDQPQLFAKLGGNDQTVCSKVSGASHQLCAGNTGENQIRQRMFVARKESRRRRAVAARESGHRAPVARGRVRSLLQVAAHSPANPKNLTTNSSETTAGYEPPGPRNASRSSRNPCRSSTSAASGSQMSGRDRSSPQVSPGDEPNRVAGSAADYASPIRASTAPAAMRSPGQPESPAPSRPDARESRFPSSSLRRRQ